MQRSTGWFSGERSNANDPSLLHCSKLLHVQQNRTLSSVVRQRFSSHHSVLFYLLLGSFTQFRSETTTPQHSNVLGQIRTPFIEMGHILDSNDYSFNELLLASCMWQFCSSRPSTNIYLESFYFINSNGNIVVVYYFLFVVSNTIYSGHRRR